jgi:RNA polymerase sigma-70 factor (ECF subfamily)
VAAPARDVAQIDDYATLVRDAQSGDPEAVERLVERAARLARRFSLAVCGHANDSDDTMQDALVQTFRHAKRINDPKAFRAWLYRTVKNACLLNRRRHVAEPADFEPVDDLTIPVADRSPEEQAVAEAGARRLRGAVQRLPQSYREVIFLREMEGLSTREAAQVLGTSEDNVKTRLRRARIELRRVLGGLEAP